MRLNVFKRPKNNAKPSGLGNSLIRAAAKGNEKAFKKIFDYYAPPILRVTRYYFQSDALAEELVQEVFTELMTCRSEFKGMKEEQFRVHIFTLEKSTAIRKLEIIFKGVLANMVMRSKGFGEGQPGVGLDVSPVQPPGFLRKRIRYFTTP